MIATIVGCKVCPQKVIPFYKCIECKTDDLNNEMMIEKDLLC